MNYRPFVNILKLTILQIFILSNIISADVRYVSKTGTSQFPYTSWETAADSIPKCIKACNNGDTIYVANGIYKDSLYIDKEISLIGSSMDSTIIDGTGLGYVTIEIQAKTTIKYFTIYGLALNSGRGLRCYQPLNISLCKISNCGAGISTIGVPCIMNNVIIINSGVGFDGGCISDTCNYFITNSMIVLSSNGSFGIGTNLGGNYFINNNILIYFGTNPDYGISLDWPHRAELSNNLVSGYSVGIYFDTIEDSGFVKNNIVAHNTYCGIAIGSTRENIENTMIISNPTGILSLLSQEVSHNSNYNIFWNNNIDLHGLIVHGDSDWVADPMFMKDTYPNPQLDFDYHLQAFSPGINKGNPSILNKDLSRSDIGMYGGFLGETYKYDDLAPKPPRNLSAVIDSLITIKWDKNTEADTSYYNIYRDTIPGFTIDPSKGISRQKDTSFVQLLLHNTRHLYYKLTAEDKTGHVSAPSAELTVTLNSIGNNYSVINDYHLYQNYPNPFNPTTTISYQLKEKSYAKLMVYDITGRLIKVLANETKESGYYETDFNAKGLASGIYLYRIEVIGKGNIPVFSDMKKCVLIK
ncbi:MAG: T9SS type A sorting domain-containing protein [Ignavibacteriaceae bacterium]|nr:T9SS type A sorting domain-containing protein [Ignavibacteriaceae bacterium]